MDLLSQDIVIEENTNSLTHLVPLLIFLGGIGRDQWCEIGQKSYIEK